MPSSRSLIAGFFSLDMSMTSLCSASLSYAAVELVYGVTYIVQNRWKSLPMWVTIYDLGKTTHLDYGCVSPRSFRRWGSGNSNPGGFYYVRAEVMAKENCQGIKLYDTTVQQNFQAGDDTWKNVLGSWRIHRRAR